MSYRGVAANSVFVPTSGELRQPCESQIAEPPLAQQQLKGLHLHCILRVFGAKLVSLPTLVPARLGLVFGFALFAFFGVERIASVFAFDVLRFWSI
jgi:hypothetical protein